MSDTKERPFFVFIEQGDGSEGLYLGNVYATDMGEAMEQAKRYFKQFYKRGLIVIDSAEMKH